MGVTDRCASDRQAERFTSGLSGHAAAIPPEAESSMTRAERQRLRAKLLSKHAAKEVPAELFARSVWEAERQFDELLTSLLQYLQVMGRSSDPHLQQLCTTLVRRRNKRLLYILLYLF